VVGDNAQAQNKTQQDKRYEMARRKKGNPVHGWLVLDKPTGATSTRALAIVKRLFNAQKAGHAGTLDPLATGVLPIAFGEATKTTSFVVDGTKTYRFTVAWGVETDTDDSEGDEVSRSDARPSPSDIEALLPAFTGTIEQVPPAFSAIKVNGQRAYDLAREGEAVALSAREITVDALRLVETDGRDGAVLEATCGKGTYVRALARDIGRELGCLGHVTQLRRTQVGNFLEQDAQTIDDLTAAIERAGSPTPLIDDLLPIEAALDTLVGLRVEPADAAQLARGQPVLIRGRDAPDASKPVYAMSKGRVIALGEIDKGALKPTRVFNFSK